MTEHYVKVSELLEWIKRQRNAPRDEEDYGEITSWDTGYDCCLDSIRDHLEDFPLESEESFQKRLEEENASFSQIPKGCDICGNKMNEDDYAWCGGVCDACKPQKTNKTGEDKND